MSQTFIKHRIWLIPVCVVVAAAFSFFGWQQLNAQDMETPQPAAPAVSPTLDPNSPSYDPPLDLAVVLPAGVKRTSIRNWDGTATQFLNFKYKTLDDRVMTVRLPAAYNSEQKTRAAWDTLFQVFAMDLEDQIDKMAMESLPDLSGFSADLLKEIQGQTPINISAEDINRAMEFARSNLSSTYGGGVTLPPMLPGMF